MHPEMLSTPTDADYRTDVRDLCQIIVLNNTSYLRRVIIPHFPTRSAEQYCGLAVLKGLRFVARVCDTC